MLSYKIPIMMTRLIDCLWRKRNQLGPFQTFKGMNLDKEITEALKIYLEKLPKLKNEMITNKEISTLTSYPTLEDYFTPRAANVQRENFRWFFVPFLFSEVYFFTQLFIN